MIELTEFVTRKLKSFVVVVGVGTGWRGDREDATEGVVSFRVKLHFVHGKDVGFGVPVMGCNDIGDDSGDVPPGNGGAVSFRAELEVNEEAGAFRE